MRRWIWIVAIIGLILLLKTQFPYAMERPDQMAQLGYLLAFLFLISGSGLLKRMTATQAVRDGMIWLALILALVLGYSYRGDLRYSRLASALIPSRIQVTGDGALSVQASQDGHFHIEAMINGTPVNFLVDTGASDIVLSPQDAMDAGYDIQTLNYTRTYSTANGIGKGAPVKIDVMDVGPFTLKGVPASVNSAGMDTSLLGMAFLNQFRQYRVEGDTLTLYP